MYQISSSLVKNRILCPKIRAILESERMIHKIADYLKEHQKELDLRSSMESDLTFFKVGGNPWGNGRINFLVFNKEQSEPILFVKSMRERDKDESLRREYNIIKKLASYRELTPFLPLPVHMASLSGHDVMLQKACHGERIQASLSKSPILHFQKQTIEGNFSRSLEFITTFNKSIQNESSPAEFRREIIDPFLSFYEGYGCSNQNRIALTRLLEKLCQIMGDSPIITPIHGDYSATNIFVDLQNQIKIIDWETATENSLPFLDLFYFMSKYIHNLKTLPKDRWQRVKRSYFGNGWLSGLIHKTVHEYCEQTLFSVELGRSLFPLHFLNKARIKYSMRGREQAQLWMNLFEYSMHNLDNLCF